MSKLKYPSNKWGSLEEVEKRHRKEKDINLKQKLNAIRLLMKGKTQKEISEFLDVNTSTIRNWRINWDRSGFEGLKAQHKGSVSKVSNEMKAEIENIIDIKREINGKSITAKLITGYLKKNIN